MFSTWNLILFKIVVIIFIILIFYKLTNSSLTNSSWSFDSISDYDYNIKESFITSIEKQKINYLKLRETHIDSEDTSLELLYANYNGDEVGNKVWKDKNLEQCTELCNKMEGCIGFSRDSVLDNEPANCYPRNIVSKCHSNRKGNLKQMQKAIKYNSFIKSNVNNILNTCIGDTELTLNRMVYIKSYAMPNKYIGHNGDSRIYMIDKDNGDFKQKCNFRIEQGQDGVGTVSFVNIDTSKYLYRDSNDNLILKSIIKNKTEDNQRVSFNIYDSSKDGGIMLKAMTIEGETTDKFIIIDNNYLVISKITTKKTNNDENDETEELQNETEFQKNNKSNEMNAIFYIIDSIIDSNIITEKTDINTMSLNNSTPTEIMSKIPQITNNPNNITNKKTKTIEEGFTVNLDTTKDLPIYNNIYETPNTVKISNYLTDNYMSYQSNPAYNGILNTINSIITKKESSNLLSKNQDEYKAINELNMEIEKEISNINMDLNGKNDKIINGLDKMRISDMANDYFFLKNLQKV